MPHSAIEMFPDDLGFLALLAAKADFAPSSYSLVHFRPTLSHMSRPAQPELKSTLPPRNRHPSLSPLA